MATKKSSKITSVRLRFTCRILAAFKLFVAVQHLLLSHLERTNSTVRKRTVIIISIVISIIVKIAKRGKGLAC